MRRNPCLVAALDELEAAGVRNVEVVVGRKHVTLHWTGRGRRTVIVSKTPSSWLAPRAARGDVRRILRADSTERGGIRA